MKATLLGAAMLSVLTTTVVPEILEIDILWGISETKADAPLLQNHSASPLRPGSSKVHFI